MTRSHKSRFIFFTVLALLFFSSAANPGASRSAKDPGLEDFDGAMVFSGKEGSLLVLEIPKEVYSGLRQRDLGDIRIFDASEKAVPFIIRELPKEAFTPPPEDVPFFIWEGGREKLFPANTDIEINTSGGVVRIKSQNSLPGRAPVYLVDLSFLKYLPSALKITTDNQEKNFNSPVSIHYSADLSNWISASKKQILASYGANIQDTLELGGDKNTRYLLIGFEGEAPPPISMTVSYRPQERDIVHHEQIIQGKISSDGKKLNYNLESFYLIESIDFVLAEADSIPVLVKNRYSEDDEWKVRARETIFRYSSGGSVIRSEPFKIVSQAPFWELETTGELAFSSVPECVIRWKPRELIFPARGKGPWTLAYGNAAAGPLRAGELQLPGGGEELERAVFTGEKRYEKKEMASQTKFKTGKFLPWAFLGAAVITLSLLALHIAKSMRKRYYN